MKKVGILGAGTMGAGIAQVFAVNGYDVVISDISQEFVDGGIAKVDKALSKLVAKEKMTAEDKDAAIARLSGSPDTAIFADCDIVIEAATENPEIKKGLFKKLDEIVKPEGLLVSNTSSLSVTELAMATKRPDKVMGMHFFNPVPAMKLVEAIRGAITSDETNEAVVELSKAIGKTPVQVEEAPGFVVNRILIPMINEGACILNEGIASAEDIDTAMKLGANHPMGPLALGDLVGLDVCLAIMNVLYTEFGDSKYAPSPLLKKMVRAGKLGRKTGEGFFKYE